MTPSLAPPRRPSWQTTGSGAGPVLSPWASRPYVPPQRKDVLGGRRAGLLEPRPAGSVGRVPEVTSSVVPLLPPRLLRSLVSLKQVIINAAHYLVLGDKETYHFDPAAPFLQMVSPLLDPLGRPSGVCSPVPGAGVGGCCSSSTCPGTRMCPPCPPRTDGGGGGQDAGSGRASPQLCPPHPLNSRMTAASITTPCQSARWSSWTPHPGGWKQARHRGRAPPTPPTRQPGAVAPWASSPLPCRYVVLFNPLEQERLSLASLLVSSPHVRVFSEEGQPLAVQISAHWSSATEMVPDVYQVSKGALALCPSAPSSHPPAYAPPGDRSPGDRHFWDLRLCWKGGWLGRVTTAQRLPHRPLVL